MAEKRMANQAPDRTPDQVMDAVRDAAVAEMARALPDPGIDPGRRCLTRTFSINETLGGTVAPTEMRSPAGDPRNPETVVFMPEESHAELIMEREKDLWLPEELTGEQQVTVDAYAREAAPAVTRAMSPDGGQSPAERKDEIIRSLLQAALGVRRAPNCWCENGVGNPMVSGCQATCVAMKNAAAAAREALEAPEALEVPEVPEPK